jgi:hypothetical protein
VVSPAIPVNNTWVSKDHSSAGTSRLWRWVDTFDSATEQLINSKRSGGGREGKAMESPSSAVASVAPNEDLGKSSHWSFTWDGL